MNKSASENFALLKIRVARNSLYAALFITFIKYIAAYFSGSLSVLSEMFHSGIDIVACTLTILSVKLSAKPPDEDHNYGHDKIENFVAIIQVLILFFLCAYILFEVVQRFTSVTQPEVVISYWTFGVILISIGIDINRTKALRKIAAQTRSKSLEADALHFSSDILSSVIVLIAMTLTYLDISIYADSIGAILVCGVIIFVGAKLFKRSLDALMDRVPSGLRQKIISVTKSLKNVEDIKSLRIRSTGNVIFIDMTIFISRLIPFSKVHDITEEVENKIREIIPHADIIIHSEPVETQNETINDKIRIIVNNEGFNCHDIFSHKIGKEIFTELHIEIDDTNNLHHAHEIVDKIESKIKNQIGIINNVKVHIDEPGDVVFETVDITLKSSDLIVMAKQILKEYKSVKSSDDFKIVSAGGKIRVSLNCTFINDLSFEQVHELVTMLESRIYLDVKAVYPHLSNVIIHSEPQSL
ncbi:cation-efflux pump [Ignavibacteria bacterium CHB1]|jgi:cation diffusion facilitator family transporter|nr:MAG: cation transporter [Chlorobiota bacterium]KXK01620.1 MAG: cation diffusion facilitator family transporter [Chlorobi bacterium OLB4]MBV6398643.1 Ferrous-iron efflux pump FieF [Ignavibacteria bacterium]MCC6885189.1 cation diffusion facilitator family transporter [Ignavibacteriales bacterium]MCE7952021.1 cation transporter [Chlorobi bacterium CHB7]MDL1886421.1 cation-efflux pump [Ignavibacteria bacterium CHB1]OQY77690.1 MAG: hypothetical protein B6D43_04070 [Ignavibacteriales bacterium U